MADTRHVRRLPPDPQAADELSAWSRAADVMIDLSYLDASGADLTDADLAMGLFCVTRLVDTVLAGADLYRAHLEGAVLDGADLSRSCLVKAVLDEASMRGTVLSGANLGSAELYGVDARAASFRGARLNGASFLDVRLEGADLTGATVAGTAFRVLLGEDTVVEGLSGTVHGPARVGERGARRELAGPGLEEWLNRRGASVAVIPPLP
ncbi:pentapeptide repeat-containing protein [Streptomyces seoulensis]|uniref:pentapeptide repeat-containing protein n=1 Tax=Streptomyces seoulensis TaxID=73044 RepID=UPI003D766DA7